MNMNMAPICVFVITVGAMSSACGRADNTESTPAGSPQAPQQAPQSLEMGGKKSVMTFFVTSRGSGKGGDRGGLAGADAHCAALAKAEGAGDHTWRAYLSASATDGQPAMDARDRIGKGPWYNAEGLLVANSVVSAVQRLLPGQGDSPVMVSFCAKPAAGEAAPQAACAVKAPAKERSLLEAIDRAVEQHDRNARKTQARG